MTAPDYVELAATSCFSFLRGASSPEELMTQAALLGYAGFAVTDINTLAGVVRPYRALRDAAADGIVLNVRPIVGARLRFLCGAPDVLVYPEDREGYARLCRFLTLGGTGDGVKKGECRLVLDDLLADGDGLCLALVGPPQPDDDLDGWLDRLLAAAPDRVWLAAAMRYGPIDARRLDVLAQTAERTGAKLLAVGDVLYHAPERRPLQDVMTCIGEHVSLEAAGRLLEPNAERHLKPREEIAGSIAIIRARWWRRSGWRIVAASTCARCSTNIRTSRRPPA